VLQLIRTTAVLAATWAVCACDSPAAPADTPAAIRRVVVLGDSLAVTPTLKESFPAVLQELMNESGTNAIVINAGVSGDTTSGGLRRLDAALSAGAHVLVVALGANDGVAGVAIDRVEQNVSQIVERAQRRGVQVLLCGMDAPPFHGLDYSVAFHQIFTRLARQHDVPLVPSLLPGIFLDRELIGPDGVHPNAAGARRIAETIWPYLQPLLR
jgi:acyl-CoA thioesterase-1